MRIRLVFLMLVGALAGGCSGVEYHQKKELGRRIMQLDANPLETDFESKILSSREVSGGRPGNSAGGGCGCSN